MSIKYKIYLVLWILVCALHIAYLCKYERIMFAVGSEWLVYSGVALMIGLRGIENEKSKN